MTFKDRKKFKQYIAIVNFKSYSTFVIQTDDITNIGNFSNDLNELIHNNKTQITGQQFI